MICEMTLGKTGEPCGRTAAYKIDGRCICVHHAMSVLLKKYVADHPECVLGEPLSAMSKEELMALVRKLRGRGA